MTNRQELLARLERYDLFAKKSLGQNFLVDPSALDAIADSVGDGDVVIEIGPGPGTLTERLLARYSRVVAVEKDGRFIELLHTELGDDRLTVHHGDILDTPVAPLVPDAVRPPIVGNIPYNITTPILLSMLAQRHTIGPLVVMLQREVADRLVAKVNTKAYGSLTVLFSVHAAIARVRNVPASCFVPRPRVDSTVLRFDWRDEPLVPIGDPAHFETVLRAAFGRRRKTLKNALSARFDKETIELARSEIDLVRRAETLTVEEFGRLALALGAAVSGR